MMELYQGAADLVQGLECEYITLFLRDILRFDSNIDGLRAYTLYEHLRMNSDNRRTNTRIISTKEFKELFNIPKDGKGSYMRENGGFDRANFEKRVIEPVLKMLGACEHVVLHERGRKPNGERIYYTKIKKHGLVQGYELMYTINKYPRAVKPETIIDVQENPVDLKIAQDVKEGKKKPKKNTFNNFEGRKYDFNNLESQLLKWSTPRRED